MDSPDKNMEVDNCSLLQGIFPTKELNLGLAGKFFTSWTTKEAQEYWSG